MHSAKKVVGPRRTATLAFGRASGADSRSLLFRHDGAARHGTYAAFAAIILHGVRGLASDHCNVALALTTRVLGANARPLLTALARRSNVLGCSNQGGFAGFALHHDHVVGADFLGLGKCGDRFGAAPIFRTWTGVNK